MCTWACAGVQAGGHEQQLCGRVAPRTPAKEKPWEPRRACPGLGTPEFAQLSGSPDDEANGTGPGCTLGRPRSAGGGGQTALGRPCSVPGASLGLRALEATHAALVTLPLCPSIGRAGVDALPGRTSLSSRPPLSPTAGLPFEVRVEESELPLPLGWAWSAEPGLAWHSGGSLCGQAGDPAEGSALWGLVNYLPPDPGLESHFSERTQGGGALGWPGLPVGMGQAGAGVAKPRLRGCGRRGRSLAPVPWVLSASPGGIGPDCVLGTGSWKPGPCNQAGRRLRLGAQGPCGSGGGARFSRLHSEALMTDPFP